jgi:hopanoid biosynthesis associated protein HpnK
MKRALIVNADDFGFTAGVNRAIIAAHTRGIVTSATVMVNMPAFDEAAALAQAHPTLGVGLHFNLTQGRPVASGVSSLLDADGEFLGTSTSLAWRAIRGQLEVAHIQKELCAQLERAFAAGLKLTHVDSHQHAHALPVIFRVLVETLPAYGLTALRLPREMFAQSWPRPSLTVFGLTALSRLNLRRLRGAPLRTTNAFLGLAQTGTWTKDWLLRNLRTLPDGLTELMCHPGYDDEQLQAAATRLRAARERELALLTDPETAALLKAQDIRLMHFGQLENAF